MAISSAGARKSRASVEPVMARIATQKTVIASADFAEKRFVIRTAGRVKQTRLRRSERRLGLRVPYSQPTRLKRRWSSRQTTRMKTRTEG